MSSLSLPEAVDVALGLLGKDGGIAIGERSNTANIRWANSDLTTNGSTVDDTLSIGAIVHTADGPGIGIASGQFTDRSDIENLIARARASAIAGGVAEDAADLFAGPTHDDFSHAPAELNIQELHPLSSALGELFQSHSEEFFGYAEQSVDTAYVGTSAGTRMRFSLPTSRFELCGKSDSRTKSAWSGQSGTSLADVNVPAHAKDVLQGLAWQNTRIDIEPGLHDVTLSPSAVSDLMIYMMWSASAREAHEGRSVFSKTGGGTRIGDQLSSRALTIAADPQLAGLETIDHVVALGSSSFSSSFDNGLPIERVEIVKDGVLNALGSNRHVAREAGLPFTPLADNIEVVDRAGHGNLTDLAARMGDGLLITCLWYIREVDPQSLLLTGLTRDGVYVVRDGEVVGCTSNFRFNESPVGMLDRISDAGAPINCQPREWGDWFSRARVAPLTIHNFNLSTKSEAI